MLLFFLILSEKYARYYNDLSSSYVLGFFFSFTFLSIFNFLLLMLNTLLHYLKNKKMRDS